MGNVPTLQSASLAPTNIQVGPGMLWTNVTKPADTTYLVVSGNLSGATDQRVYGPVLYTVSGTFVGSTVGASTFSYKPTFVDIQIEQSVSIVEKVLNTETASCQFSIAELTAENMQITGPGEYWHQPVATVTTATDAYQAGQTLHKLTIGGLRLVAPQCIAFISANRRITAGGGASTQAYSYVFCGYNAIAVDGFNLPFERGKETVYQTKFDMVADTARTIGDQLFQMVTRMSA